MASNAGARRRGGRSVSAVARTGASVGVVVLVGVLAAGCDSSDASAASAPATTTPGSTGTILASTPSTEPSAGTRITTPEPSATSTDQVSAGAAPGACGWRVDDPGADGTKIDASDKAFQLVVLATRQGTGASSVTVDTSVAAVQDQELPKGLTTTEPTLLLVRDGAVVARTDAGDGASADPDRPVDGGELVAKVTTSGIKPIDCESDAALTDGTYQVWALETVQTSKGKKSTLLGGGQDVEIASGAPVPLCGADVGALPDGTDDVTLTAEATYDVPDVDPATHPKKQLSASLAVKHSAIDVTGAYESTIYLVDDDGRIVADGTEPGHRTAGVIEPIAVSSGGGGDGRAYDQPSTSCHDGRALAKGTYRAVVDLAVDRADGKPGVLHLVATSKDVVIR
ncbi:hypothetical protein IC607_12405 [Cellulomonas sp. JH27-2]|uniref:hypothetical protein n=1 Tax=Cellulomonas sp. JH27-2 TaxID=2774139 RepID=UPI001781FA63|nr:hypothetical protein [Cellulomonas sp. JH27-2]MBD8059769.1 hypothetical protein [Cellulomonas sp. JH27-2]